MSELFEDDIDEVDVSSEDIALSYTQATSKELSSTDVRRKLEDLLEAKRLREELEDFLD